jgi:hypothetical protein
LRKGELRQAGHLPIPQSLSQHGNAATCTKHQCLEVEMSELHPPEGPGIPLCKVVQDLRAELLAAVAEGAGKDLRFKLQPIELELEIAMTWSGEAKAGVKFWIVDVGAKGSAERKTTQKLKLVLDPVDREGRSGFYVRDTNRQGLGTAQHRSGTG